MFLLFVIAVIALGVFVIKSKRKRREESSGYIKTLVEMPEEEFQRYKEKILNDDENDNSDNIIN